MKVRCLLMHVALAGVVTALGGWMPIAVVHAAGTPPLTKETKPATSTMSGSEQKGSNVGRNANTKPTAPAPQPKK